MRVLVTGGAGFIGSNLVKELLNDNNEVIVVDNESAVSSNEFVWFKEAENYKIDILDFSALEKIFNSKIDFVFHLAAETKIQLSIDDPKKCFMNNIIGTFNVLELSRKYNVKRVLIASSSSIYGNNLPPNQEQQKVDCLNPYAASKLCDEVISKLYYNLYNLETICFRFFNVYGDNMPNVGSYAPVISVFKKQKKQNQLLTITGDGLQKRDFIHVNDVVDGLICGMKTNNKKCFGNFYNLGFGANISVLEIAQEFNSPYCFIEKRIGDAEETLANIELAETDLNWKPKIDLKSWLKEYVNK